MSDDFFTPQTVEQALGKTFTSGWHLIDQRRISVFGEGHATAPDLACGPKGKERELR